MKTAMYFHSNGSHLATAMAHNAIAFGSRGYTLKNNETAIALEKLQDGTVIGCIVQGTGKKTNQTFQHIWPNWKPSNPHKVVTNKVIFKTKLHILPKHILGKLSQAGIKQQNQAKTIQHFKKWTKQIRRDPLT